MRPIAWVLMAAVALALGLVAGPGYALELDGFVSGEQRYLVGDGSATGDAFGKARFELSHSATTSVFLLASAELRYYHLPVQETLTEVGELESSYRGDALLWETYLAADQLIWSSLDVKIGKQRIAWGRADRFNPTDNLNPDDLTDPFDFGAKVPSWAALATVYLGDSELTAVWLPVFEPALLARGGTAALLGMVPDRVERPISTVGNGRYALKFTSLAFNVDYSLSYFSGFDGLPVPVPEADGLVFRFPEIEVFGFDFAGELGSVGFRGEAAHFRPQNAAGTPMVVPPAEPYKKYTLGVEYTFSGGMFVEAQLVHGFITERGAENLGDFLLLTAEQTFLNDELKLTLTAAGEARDDAQGEPLKGGGLFLELDYALLESLELSTGAFFLNGDDGTLFGRMRDADQVFLKSKFSF